MSSEKKVQRTVHFRNEVAEFIEAQRKDQEIDMSFSVMADLIIYRVMRQQVENGKVHSLITPLKIKN